MRDRRRIQILVVSCYLLYTIYEADYNLRQSPNYFDLLGVPFAATEREVKSQFRRLAALHHPDKAASSSSSSSGRGPQEANSHDYFILLRQAAETLSDPAARFAYERFGPDIHSWQSNGNGSSKVVLKTIREFMMRGLSLKIPHYAMGALAMYFFSLVGYLRFARWWRWTFFFFVGAAEVYLCTRARFPPVLTDVVNPIATSLLKRPLGRGYLPFELIQLVRQISVTTYIGFNQLGPLLLQSLSQAQGTTIGATTDGTDMGEKEEQEALEQCLKRLDQAVVLLQSEAARLVDMETAPFAGDNQALNNLKGKVRDWLVQNTVRADPLVRDSIGNGVRRRRAEVPFGARGN